MAGLEEAGRKLHVATGAAAPETEADLPGIIGSFVDSGECDLIIGVGFIVAGAMEPYVAANRDHRFAVIDFEYGVSYDNVAELLLQVDQAAFLAGYVAAAISDTGKAGVYGDANITPVTTSPPSAGPARYRLPCRSGRRTTSTSESRTSRPACRRAPSW